MRLSRPELLPGRGQESRSCPAEGGMRRAGVRPPRGPLDERFFLPRPRDTGDTRMTLSRSGSQLGPCGCPAGRAARAWLRVVASRWSVLDGSLRDQVVDLDETVLAEAARANGGLVLDGGAPRSVEVDDMPGPSEVSPAPTARTDRMSASPSPDWNRSTISCRAASGTSRRRGRCRSRPLGAAGHVRRELSEVVPGRLRTAEFTNKLLTNDLEAGCGLTATGP